MTWFEACQLDELSTRGRELLVGGRIIALFFIDQRVLAVDGMCAHQGGPIAAGEVKANCVTCPWHGWQYDLRDGSNLLTGKKMLETF